MTTIRRWYIFLVCAVSLQAVTWALIALLRNLLTSEGQIPLLKVAFSLSVVLIGFPLYLAHWLWEGWLTRRDPEERGSTLRHLYLYGMMAGFLLPLIYSADSVLNALFQLLMGNASLPYQPSYGLRISRSLLALLPLATLWLYHYLQSTADARLLPPAANTALIRRLYVLIFSGFGLLVMMISSADLLRWLLVQMGNQATVGVTSSRQLVAYVAWLIVSIPLWVVHWLWAQRLFYHVAVAVDEKASALRKLYLYAVVFTGVIGVVSQVTILLAGLLRRALGLSAQGDWRNVLPWIIVHGVIWAYHAMQIQRDSRQSIELPQQAAIRRLYRYLVAACGLMALLIGVGGNISVLIRAISGSSAYLLKEQLAWFSAALVTGLPVWFLPWRTQQMAAMQAGESGVDESRSLARRIYLVLFVFAATMTVLTCAITIVYRLLSTLFGESAVTFSELTQAIAFALIALGVWLYHGSTILSDSRRVQRAQVERLAALPVLVWRDADGWAEAIVIQARSEISGIDIEFAEANDELPARVAAAGVLVFPWTIYRPESGTTPEMIQIIAASPAHKLLLPVCPAEWDWAGVERWEAYEAARHATRALKQILADESVRFSRPLGIGVIVASTIGALILFVIGFIAIVSVIQMLV